MIRHSLGRFSVLSLITVSLALPGGVFGTFTTFSEGGDATAASILDTVNAFRAALGDPNNGNDPGPLPSGRREINWDGGGAATTLSSTPFEGFLNNRGALFTTAGAGFVQATPLGFEQTFGNTTLEESFGVFSPQRIFSPIGSNITDVTFFIPGTAGSEAATVSGFGAIFTDVDFGDSSSLKFYDVGNNLIFEGNVPAGTVRNKSLSFLGAIAQAGERIFRVQITSGDTAIASSFPGEVDIAAMDDFIYSEPQRVPETGGIGLLGLGLGFILVCYRRFLAVA